MSCRGSIDPRSKALRHTAVAASVSQCHTVPNYRTYFMEGGGAGRREEKKVAVWTSGLLPI